jgi:hypothetical protein
MVSVPAPLLFQYMERSTMIFLPEVLEVTMMEALFSPYLVCIFSISAPPLPQRQVTSSLSS